MDALPQHHESTYENPAALYNPPRLPFGGDLPYYFADEMWHEDTQNPFWFTTNASMSMGLPTGANESSFPPLDTNKVPTPADSISPPGFEATKASHSSSSGTLPPANSDSGVSGVSSVDASIQKPQKPSKPSRRSTRKAATRRSGGSGSSSVSLKELEWSKVVVEPSPDDSNNMPMADIGGGEDDDPDDDNDNEQDDEDEADDDKSRLRARNRKAAAKFRVRKKCDTEKLRETEEAARELNKVLNQEAAKLREECLKLKNMVLDHAGCGCPPIDDYIQSAAAGAWKAGN